MLLPDWIVLLMAIGGGCLYLLGAHRTGWGFLLPAIWRWLLYPFLEPVIHRMPVGLMLVATPLLVMFGSLLLLQRLTGLVYGQRTAAHVTATYIIRVLDGIGVAMIAVIRTLLQSVVRLLTAHE